MADDWGTPSNLKGWHRGELAIQRKLNCDSAMSTAYTWIAGDLGEEQRQFHTTRLPFVPITTLDDKGRPWGSILAGRDGRPGFIKSPNAGTLVMDVALWEGDPLMENSKLFGRRDKMLTAGIGIEFPTRRRNKFAGWISDLARKDNMFKLTFKVIETIGNCPKYINIRDLVPSPNTSPKVIYRQLNLLPTDRLPEDVISFIHDSDTLFIGTTYEAREDEKADFPSHVGMNQRGGRRGFTRVMHSDGRTVVVPDYSGNRLLTSLGNIEATGLASLTFVSFTTGAILYLTGTAKTLLESDAKHIMPLQRAVTTIHVTGYVLVESALPVRQRPNSPVGRSPYSPPIHHLAGEDPTTLFDEGSDVCAVLTKIEPHSPTLATFSWELSKEVRIIPGQAAIMDFTPFLGRQAWSHMADYKPTSLNDDRIRTWTVSSAQSSETRTFSLTMREKPKGAVTGALFAVMRKLGQVKPEVLADTKPLELSVGLVGITGEFVLPKIASEPVCTRNKLLWIAGGIGLTPFLSMLSALAATNSEIEWDVSLQLSTREPDVLLRLISHALRPGDIKEVANKRLHLAIDIFSNKDSEISNLQPCGMSVSVNKHQGRISQAHWSGMDLDREVYLCGPSEFEQAVLDGLEKAGFERTKVKKESYEY